MTYQATYTTALSGSQDGYSSAGVWNDAGNSLVVQASPAVNQPGLVFELATERQFEGGIIIDPPVLVSMSLRLTTHSSVLVDPGSALVEVWGVPEFDPLNYSNTRLPFGRNEVFLGSATYVYAGDFTPLSIPLTAPGLQTLRAYWAHSRWQGRVALSVRTTTPVVALTFDSVETGSATPPQLITTEEVAFTGLQNAPERGARAVRCPRTGFPFMADEAVEDGFRKGLWVSPRAWDPPDTRNEGRQFVPPPDESVAKDKVPS